MKDRIKQIMEAVGLSQQDFAKELGISAASLSSIFTGRTNPTNNHVMAIHRVFPQINVNWLLFGEGDMIMKNQATNAPSLDKDLADETTTEEENLDASATNENLDCWQHEHTCCTTTQKRKCGNKLPTQSSRQYAKHC